ncbi:MAG UNVERIFIED_CONTAM: helix-hairpin-helix domain-containing protein [Planctomycetaceae bacterium]
MNNDAIASQFELLADLLEIQAANPFRICAYRNAARTISGLAESLADMVVAEADLQELPGIGGDLARQIVEIVRTGQHTALQELKQQVPAGVLDMLRIPGVGPKKAAVFFHQLGLTTLEQLKAACESGRIGR